MGKSSYHRSENTFRFQTFSERIADINIDVIHKIKHHDDTPDENSTYFGDALEKWTELNCTKHFTSFRRRISHRVQNFAQLVHHEDDIVSALKEHLLVPNSLAYEPLLDLLVQLARDLQTDFYKHFREFFDILVQLLNNHPQDTELLEKLFSALSYIFKFLWRYLVQDIKEVYGYFSNLLSQQYRPYIRHFAAESFAFLMRKVKNHGALFDFLLKSLKKAPENAEGVGWLMFEMMKGVKKKFHSCTSKVFPILLYKAGHCQPDAKKVKKLPWLQVESCLLHTVQEMANHTDKENADQLWTCLLGCISTVHKHWMSGEGDKNLISKHLIVLLKLSEEWMSYKKGAIISHPDQVATMFFTILCGQSLPEDTGLYLIDTLSAFLISSHSHISVFNTARLISAVFKAEFKANLTITFTQSLVDLPIFEKDVLPGYITYCVSKASPSLMETSVAMFTEVLMSKVPFPGDGQAFDSSNQYPLDFTADKGSTFLNFVMQTINSADLTDSKTKDVLDRVWSAVVCLPHIRSVTDTRQERIKCLKDLLPKVIKQINSGSRDTDKLLFLFCFVVLSLLYLQKEEEMFELVPMDLMKNLFKSHSHNIYMLMASDLYFTQASVQAGRLQEEYLLDIFPALQENLTSWNAKIRLTSIRILSLFPVRLPHVEDLDPARDTVFQTCLSAETVPLTVQHFRERRMYIQRLEFDILQNSVPIGPFSQVAVRYLIGSLFTNFKLLWEPTTQLIAGHAKGLNKNAFWEMFNAQLDMAAEKAEDELNEEESTEQDMEGVTLFGKFCQQMAAGNTNDKPDFTNFRLHLWKTMHLFPEICENKSKILSPLMFRFLKNEYFMSDTTVAPTENICKRPRRTVTSSQIYTSQEDSKEQDKNKKPFSEREVEFDLEQNSLTTNDIAEETQTSSITKIRSTRSRKTSTSLEDDDEIHSIQTRSHGKTLVPVGIQEEVLPMATRSSGRKRRSSVSTGIHEEVVPMATRSSGRTRSSLSADIEEEVVPMATQNSGRTRRSSRISEQVQPMATRRSARFRMSSESIEEKEEVDNSGEDMESTIQDVTTRRKTRSRKSSVSVEDKIDEDVTEDTWKSAVEDKESEGRMNTGTGGDKSNEELDKQDEDDDDEDDDEKDEKQKINAGMVEAGNNKMGKRSRKAATSTLIVHLGLFSKFKNPRSLHMEPELRALYFELLIHRNPDVQKTAFDCIMTYKYKYLVPYRENFLRLLDDKTFKSELVLFSVDEETGQIKSEHRSELLPVLMRLLYGKMQFKTGKETTGRNRSNLRQSIVFRFLNGCNTQEIGTFLDMVFAPYKHFVRDNPVRLVDEMMRETDPKSVIPLRKIAGTVHSIDTICKKMGHLMDDFLPSLLRILLGLTATCVACLEQRERLTPFAVSLLKNLRQLAIGRLIQFFEDFEAYNFSPAEIDSIFKVAVWPQLDMLRHEGIYHATPLMKMLHLWSKMPRYILLLSIHHPDDESLTPMVHVFRLLNAKDVRQSVSSLILDMVEKLLNPIATEEESEITPLPVNNGMSVENEEVISTVEELGISLVTPHIPALLQYLQKSIVGMKSKLGRKGESMELTILSRVSSFVTDKDQCDVLVSLLLPYLDKSIKRSPASEHSILYSVDNLMKKVKNSWTFYRPVCHLFSWISSRTSRIIMCSILETILNEKEELGYMSQLVSELNSWDPKRMEDPDYLKRLSAFKKTNDIIKSMKTADVDFLQLILDNACYFIRMIDDLSIRDNSTHCLVTMVKQISTLPFDETVFRELISQGLLAEIKSGIKDKNENVRHEFISLLSILVDSFPKQPMFEDLVPLKDKDPEADFFVNIKHIQTYKRSRALRKMIKFLFNKPCRREIFTSYFLPIASSFITDDSFSKAEGLIDAAVDAIGAICHLLPWQLYYFQLKHYLSLLQKRLDKQRLLVRVLVAILDNFHFDVSESTFKITGIPDSVAKQKAAGLPTDEAADDENEMVKESDSTKITEVENQTAEHHEMDTTATPTVDGKTVCPSPLATRIHTTILQNLLPQLQNCLTEKIKGDDEHKATKSKYAEDTEILRVPIGLAMVKLLQKLPAGSMEPRLPGILIKVCNFLKSRSRDIREAARDTLNKILQSLGPKYFPYILSEMRSTLRRGYQLHVLSFTIYSLLRNMLPYIKQGQLDVCRHSLQEVFNEELFGRLSEEKEVSGITSQLFEAKLIKGYDSYMLLASRIGTKSLIALVTPLKQILDITHSHKTTNHVLDVLKKVVIGLMDNPGLSTEELTLFVHGLVLETFPQLAYRESEKKKAEPENLRKKPENCLILPSTPPRGGIKPKHSKRNNAHVIVQFGLQILSLCLKKSRLLPTEIRHLELLDPFVAVLAECLHSKHTKVNIMTLRCLTRLMKFSLPSLKENIKKISDGMFVILRNYASTGMAGGDNLELITTAFMAVTILVRDVKFHLIQNKELQVLLGFCEEDLYDHNKQSTAFTLLKAILSRKLNIPEVAELMKKVMNMAITMDSPHVRRECRQLTLQYLLDYPLGKKLIKNLEFFVGQLTYELEAGRESTLEMLATVFSSFPQSILTQHASFFFVPMSAALVNDDSAKCRKMTALAIKSLIGKLDHNNRNSLFTIAVQWMKDSKLQHRSLGFQVCGLFVEVEAAQFERHLSVMFPLIKKQINPVKFQKSKIEHSAEQDLDKLLYLTMNVFLKICRECNVLRDSKWEEDIYTLLSYTQEHLLYAHNWLRLTGAQVFGLVFAAYNPEEIATQVTGETTQTEYLLERPVEKLQKLAFDFCRLFQSKFLSEELTDQLVKNMVFIAKVTKLMKLTDDIKNSSTENEEEEEEEISEDENIQTEKSEEDVKGHTRPVRRLCIPWIVRKMIKEANHEAIKTPKVTLKRSSVFKWIAAVSLDLGPEVLPSVVHIMMSPLQREINDVTSDGELKQLSQEVLDLLKKILGVEAFTTVYTNIQKSVSRRREARKRKRAMEAVSNPEIAARRKLKKNLSKKEAKKRRIEEFRPSKKLKKMKLSETNYGS